MQLIDALHRQVANLGTLALRHCERTQFGQLLLEAVGLLAQLRQTRQARTTLEGVQATQQFVHRQVGRLGPVTQGTIHAGQQILGLLDEDLEDFRIRVCVEERSGRSSGRGRDHGFAGGDRLLTVIAQGLDQVPGGFWRQALGERFELLVQAVMAKMQQANQVRPGLDPAPGQALVEGFQGVGEIADGIHFGQACPSLEGMQISQQGFQLQTIARIGLPGP